MIELRSVCPLLQVFDMPRSIGFYRDTLGFEVLQTSRPGDDCDWAWLRLGGAELMLNTAYDEGERPPAADPVRLGAHGDTVLFFACPNLDAAHAHLCAHGVAVAPPVVQSYGMRQLSLTDPDGFALCLQWSAAD